MTREPIHAENLPNELRFPFNIRSTLAVWKLLFLHSRTLPTGRCSNCAMESWRLPCPGFIARRAPHTTHHSERSGGQEFAGGEAEGWIAYSLDGSITRAGRLGHRQHGCVSASRVGSGARRSSWADGARDDQSCIRTGVRCASDCGLRHFADAKTRDRAARRCDSPKPARNKR